MPNPPARYRAIPSSQDQAYHSDFLPVGVNLYSTSESILAETRAKWTYFLLGCTILLPWNAMINETSFFLFRLAGSPFYLTFNSYIASIYALTKLVFQFYSTITLKQSSPSRRTFVSIIAVIFLVTSLPLRTYIWGTPSTFLNLLSSTELLWRSRLRLAICARLHMLRQRSLVHLSGQAAIAVAVSVAQVASSVFSLWGLSPKFASIEVNRTDGRGDQAEKTAARIIFGISAIFVGVTLVAYMWLAKQPFHKLAIRALEQHQEVKDTDELTRLVADEAA